MLACILSACAPAPQADLRPADIGPPPALPEWPAIDPRACGDHVCVTPEDAFAVVAWRARVEAGWAALTAWGGYWRALAMPPGDD